MSEQQTLLQELRTIDEEIRWRAVQTRDRRFDDVLVYGVRSTGVYCRPSCPSRRPGRPQVTYFANPDEAEHAGFRSCKRCLPRRATTHNPQVGMIMRACRIIESNTDGAIPLSALAEKVGLSPYHLQRTFKSITGVTPRQYAEAHRIEQFKSRIKDGEPIADAIYDSGYGSSSRLYEKASERLGMTPATYQRKGKGMNIKYTIVDSYLGRLLVAATERGVCAVNFGNNDEELLSMLHSEYGVGTISRDDEGLGRWVNALLDHLDGSKPRVDLPLDLQATAFQLRVWDELRKINYGETRSYAEIAEAIGQPTATRAVARACATNPVAVVTPCHRVIRGDGTMGGYRWGLERKQALLAREKARRKERENRMAATTT
jgi:AraC family transcriptional regulator of adaptative response/methylated-DNA-[protein]-cysteine methyltransferase